MSHDKQHTFPGPYWNLLLHCNLNKITQKKNQALLDSDHGALFSGVCAQNWLGMTKFVSYIFVRLGYR